MNRYCVHWSLKLVIFDVHIVKCWSLGTKPAKKLKLLRMGRRVAMMLDQRHLAVGMLHGGASVRAVSRHFGVSASTISRLNQLYQETGRVQDRPRSGRPRKTSAIDDRCIEVTSRRNRFMSAPRLATALLSVVWL